MYRFSAGGLPGIGLLLLVLLSCSDNETNPPPQSLIAEDTYIDLLVELQLLRSYQDALPDSVVTDSLRPAIFRRHGVSAEAFARSHEYYQENLEAQKRRIDQAIERLRRDQFRQQDENADSTGAGPEAADSGSAD